MDQHWVGLKNQEMKLRETLENNETSLKIIASHVVAAFIVISNVFNAPYV